MDYPNSVRVYKVISLLFVVFAGVIFYFFYNNISQNIYIGGVFSILTSGFINYLLLKYFS